MRKLLKRILLLALGAILAFSLFGCGNSDSGNTDVGDNGGGDTPEPEAKTYEVFPDAKFETGFDIIGTGYTDDGIVDSAERATQKSIKFGKSDTAWYIAQWYSHNKLEKSDYVLNEKTFSLSDKSKTIELNRENGEITLAVNAAKDFTAPQSPATLGYFWPHLLISPKRVNSVKIADCAEMNVYIDFTVNKCVDHASEFGTAASVMNSQFAWFVYVKNTSGGEGNGEFLWLGFNLYDPKSVYAPHNAMQDNAGGTAGNYIYTFGANETIGSNPVKVGKRTGFNIDLVKAVKEGLDGAHKAGFMTHTEVEDCSITGMNIGYEMFDVWEISTTIHDMGVSYTLKSEQ